MEVSLYNGEVTVEFSQGNHRYKVNGEFKPGVTGILGVINKPLLLDWSAGMAADAYKESVARQLGEGKQITDQFLRSAAKDAKKAYTRHADTAKDLGKIVHGQIETFLNGGVPTLYDDPLVQKLSLAFITWFGVSGYAAEGTEQIVYSKKYDYCGTYDVLLSKDGQLILGDVKTTKRGFFNQAGIYTEYVAQLGGYAIAFEEESGKTVDDLCIINPDKQYGELQFITLSKLGITVQQAKDAFLCVYDLYKCLKPLEWSLKKQNVAGKKEWYLKPKLEDEE